MKKIGNSLDVREQDFSLNSIARKRTILLLDP